MARRVNVMCKCEKHTFNGLGLKQEKTCPVCGTILWVDSFVPKVLIETRDPIFKNLGNRKRPKILNIYESEY